MVTFTLNNLILSASLAVATIAAFSTAAPTAPIHRTTVGSDPCGRLGSKNIRKIKYKDVADCYKAIPIDREIASTTINAVHDLFRDFYVFTDSALTPQVPAPFASEPVDILKELKTIGGRKYTSDYQFHTDVRHAVDTLRDGHASYDVKCYNNYGFEQNLTLYAPVEEGVQTLRVYKDNAKRGYEDCIVDKIDGNPSLPHIRAWATKRVSCSHDVNARQNCALARQGYDVKKGAFLDESGEFSYQSYLPDKGYVDYELRCSNKRPSGPIRLREEWNVYPQTEIAFKDVKSYVAKVCMITEDEPKSGPQAQFRPHRRNLVIPIRKRDLESDDDVTAAADGAPRRLFQEFRDAEKLVSGNATVFYHLKTQPDTGVMVVHTFDAQDEEVSTVLKGLNALHNRNVTNILVDFQGNGGGLISLSSNLVQMLFPSKQPRDASYEADLRVNKSAQKAAAVGFMANDGGYNIYNANEYYDLQTTGPASRYKNNDLFTKPVNITRNGRTNLYSEKTAMYFDPLSAKIVKAVAKFPWTGRRENIRILTDGRCGSACGMASYFWTTTHGVESYSIGGNKGEDLSMFSFSGASVITLKDVHDTYAGLNLTSPLEELAYKNEVRFSWLELYGKNRTIPLEYDAELYRPKHRLDYTSENARSRVVMWKEVVAAAWKK
ncbi:hypothetical protein BGZ96_007853 [Linnemannia gamsii]|uniref:Tail specific protease domain-containing protein n=1 Tax=Linnemannia gamsii TaxID=64522 RepID=A0ABQ7K105_9FUNG|nr:hypothetical protein BGZ96_007853 [Linnemannia gamsii]